MPQPDKRDAKPVRRNRLLIPGLLLAVVGALAFWKAGDLARDNAVAEITQRSASTLNLVVENIRGDLAKFEIEPRLLASNPKLAAALANPDSPEAVAAANHELHEVNHYSGALDTYLMDTRGLTIAASNWDSKKTFVGFNFAFRPYFQSAMKGETGRYLAIGTTSDELGYYFSHPVGPLTAPNGVVVVKMPIFRPEGGWRAKDHDVAVLDENGVVFLTSNPLWRFRAFSPLSEDARQRIVETQKYSNRLIMEMPIVSRETRAGLGDVVTIAPISAMRHFGHIDPTARTSEYLLYERALENPDWRVLLLARTEPVHQRRQVAMAGALSGIASLALAGLYLHQRRRRIEERLLLEARARDELEGRVADRTSELMSANTLLRREIAERARAEAELRRAQAGLVQATKLAALGEMSAGLSHELNQPLAAIRSYAENARTLIERAKQDLAAANMTSITELADRMARIIRNLRTYARNEPLDVRPTALAPALTGALNLLEARIASSGVTVDTDHARSDYDVMGGSVRLQQVFVNVISNALEAMSNSPRKQLAIAIEPEPDWVRIRIADSGPGIDEQNIAKVFDPFFTTKAVGQGLGLGLSITYGLVKQFGGTIEAANRPGGGAEFTIRLRLASAPASVEAVA